MEVSVSNSLPVWSYKGDKLLKWETPWYWGIEVILHCILDFNMEYDRSPDRLLNTIHNVGVLPLEKVCFLTEILGNLFKYICFFVLFFCLLLHRLAVRISLPFHIFLQVQLYWSRSTTGRSGTTHWFVNCCGLADILVLKPKNSFSSFFLLSTAQNKPALS